MHNGCVKSVPQPDSRFETFARPVADWHARLTAGLSRSVQASDQNLGHLEEEILHATRDLERKILEEAAQQKADHSPPVCPVCGHKLSACTRDHARTFQSRFGPVTVKRRRGWYRRCQAWCFPADHALGLSETGGASPSVQEMAALTVSKMPVNEASAVLERLTGVKLPPATLDREARRHGRRAHKKRAQRDEPMRAAAGPEPQIPIEHWRHGWGVLRPIHALRPVFAEQSVGRAISPPVHFTHRADRIVPNHFAQAPRVFGGLALIAHLGSDFVFARGLSQLARTTGSMSG